MGFWDWLPWNKWANKKIDKAISKMKINFKPTYYMPPGGTSNYLHDNALSDSYCNIRGYDHSYLQLKAREILWDSLQAKSIINRNAILTINSGLRLESQPEASILGITEEQKIIWSENIEARWRVWSKLKEVDYTERRNFAQLEILAFYSYIIYNEFFIILRYSEDQKKSNPLSIQIVPPHQVQTPPADFLIGKTNKVIDGIEINKKGVEIAIWIYDENEPEYKNKYKRIKVKNDKTGKRYVLHGLKSIDSGAYRGYPDLAEVYHQLKKIMLAERNELDTMAANASIAGAIERDKDVVQNDKLSGIGSPGWGSTEEERADNEADTERPKKFEERKIKSGGFWLQNLEPGEKLKEFDTKRPNVNITDFIDRIMNYLAPALGLSNSVVKMLFGQNYSASKGEMELTWYGIDYFISDFVPNFNQAIYESWADGEAAKGRINVSGWNDTTIRAAWLSATWNGLPIPSLNPLQEAKASTELIKEGLTNREHEAQKRTGTTYSQNVTRLKSENEKLAEANKPILENQRGGD